MQTNRLRPPRPIHRVNVCPASLLHQWRVDRRRRPTPRLGLSVSVSTPAGDETQRSRSNLQSGARFSYLPRLSISKQPRKERSGGPPAPSKGGLSGLVKRLKSPVSHLKSSSIYFARKRRAFPEVRRSWLMLLKTECRYSPDVPAWLRAFGLLTGYKDREVPGEPRSRRVDAADQ